MTISTTASRISYNGNGSTTAFSFPYRFFTNTDLVVVLVSAAGVETVQTLSTDYTVTGADSASGGTVTMTTAPASGTELVIYREVDITQEVDYISGGAFPAETHERALDRLTVIAQQLEDKAGRAVRGPVTDPITINMELPGQEARADTVLTFDVNGEPQATPTDEFVAGLAGSVIGANYVTTNSTGDGSTVNFTVSTAPGAKGNIQIYIDGVYQNKNTFSISGTTVTFTEAPPSGAAIEFVVGYAIGSFGDAGDMTYTPAGTGAVTTTVQAKLRETVSVKDFGAVGDGVTDDRAAIQAAINAVGDSGVKTLYFPAGTYLCELTDGIGIKDSSGAVIHGFKAFGDGPNSTILKLGLTSDRNFQSFFGCTSINGLDISGFTFDFNEDRPTRTSTSVRYHNPAILVQGQNSANVHIHDCNFINMSVDQPLLLAGFVSPSSLVDADFIDGVVLENLNFIKAADAITGNDYQEDISVIFMYAKNARISNCLFDSQIPMATFVSTGRGRTAIEAYGYNINVTNCQFKRWRRSHIIGTYPNVSTADYFTEAWNIHGNNYKQCEALVDIAFRTHTYGPIKFSNNIVTYGEVQTGGLHAFFGFNISGGVAVIDPADGIMISDNFFDFRNMSPATTNSYTALMNFQNAPKVVFSGNTVWNNKSGIVYAEARSGDDPTYPTGYEIKNNYFFNICTDAVVYGRNVNRPIWLDSAATFGDMIITNNTWENIGVKGSRTSSGYNGNIFAGLFSCTGENLVVANNVIKGANSAYNASATYTGTWAVRNDTNNINVNETD